MKDNATTDPIPGSGAVDMTVGTYSRHIHINAQHLGDKPTVTSNITPGYEPEKDEIQIHILVGGWQIDGEWEAGEGAPDIEITQIG